MKRQRLVLGLILCMLVSTVSLGGVFDIFKKNQKSKKITLKFMTGSPRRVDIEQKYADMFAEKYNNSHDSNLKIEVEGIAGEQFMQTVKTRLVAGDSIDFIELHPLNDLPEFIKAGYVEDISDTQLSENFYPATREAVTKNSKLYATPLETVNWAMLYNKDLFDKLNLKPAKTLDELKIVVTKLKEAGYTPFLASYKDQWIPQLLLSLVVGTVDSKTDLIEKMNNNQTSLNIIKNDLFGIMDLVNNNSNKRGLSIGGTDGCAEFASGKYGMWIQGPWYSDTILDIDPNFDLGVAPLPINNDPEFTQIMQATSSSFAVLSTTKHKEIAEEFLKYLYSKGVIDNLLQDLKLNPISKLNTFKTYPWVDESLKYIKSGKGYREKKIPQPVKDESGRVFQAYYGKNITQDEVIEALNNAWKSYNEVNK